jgi:pimeloyl-ACP methyl ester carboxylesterase
MLVHGWPGSFAEFLEAAGPLSDPAAHGDAGAPAFDLVIPSIPGHGFSMPLSSTGWTTARIARAFVTLMERLGYDRYGVQAATSAPSSRPEMGGIAPERVLGVTSTRSSPSRPRTRRTSPASAGRSRSASPASSTSTTR